MRGSAAGTERGEVPRRGLVFHQYLRGARVSLQSHAPIPVWISQRNNVWGGNVSAHSLPRLLYCIYRLRVRFGAQMLPLGSQVRRISLPTLSINDVISIRTSIPHPRCNRGALSSRVQAPDIGYRPGRRPTCRIWPNLAASRPASNPRSVASGAGLIRLCSAAPLANCRVDPCLSIGGSAAATSGTNHIVMNFDSFVVCM
ncbi:hypothetical protein CC85DRAFT_95619 [Cutaneotrichosporon oleaginosum]|uniref:Uncharacterized protein n=1 Tax=Cutaneotrichosporon oleaginosum TaxID=879819 RepID=A0A0J0XMC4_9TREE|nr:uncharacterized protein CC85DRAFT_95619 [Cutaneotrichosporon oleaginosum]KLT42290.1 hypothetical protein CC85DRAFT_95619 [Cutaneotrichosporon oleaginosum]TXT11462.1 hypothetical protein COLE_01872 [Cutaneotrichosporon oleaginosum]